jgi:hypothetical protein
MREPVALDLPVPAEGKAAVLRPRVRVARLGRDAPHIVLLRGVDDHAPVEGPAALGIVERHVGAPGGAPVGSGELLHGGHAPLIGVAPAGVPAADEADIAEYRTLQTGMPFEPHPELTIGRLPREDGRS